MKQLGFKALFQNGVTINVFFNADKQCTLTIDDVHSYDFTCEQETGEVSLVSKTILKEGFAPEDAVALKELSSIDFQKRPEELVPTTCINCQGRSYCITNGCANTPCGWICDNCC